MTQLPPRLILLRTSVEEEEEGGGGYNSNDDDDGFTFHPASEEEEEGLRRRRRQQQQPIPSVAKPPNTTGLPPPRDRRKKRKHNGYHPNFLVLPVLLLLLLLFLSAMTTTIVQAAKTEETTSSSSTLSLNQPFQQESFEHLPHIPCVSLYTRSQRIGCGTPTSDTTRGRLLRWTSDLKITTMPTTTDGEDGDETETGVSLVVPEEELTSDMITLAKTQIVSIAGILVTNSTSSSASSSSSSSSSSTYYTSPASTMPRGTNTPSSNLNYSPNYPWNTNGNGIELENLYGIPLVYIPSTDLSTYLLSVGNSQLSSSVDLTTQTLLDPRGQSYIMAEYNYYMGPDTPVLSEECLGWTDVSNGQWTPKCLPLGGLSIWGTAGTPPPKVNSNNNRRKRERLLEDGNDAQGEDDNVNDNGGQDKKEVVMIATTIDGSSLYHDLSPAANAVASNIMATLLAARAIGTAALSSDDTLDGFTKQIAFGFFQADSYGFVGSRALLKDMDYPGFTCQKLIEYDGSSSSGGGSSNTYEEGQDMCLYPMRPTMAFQNIGSITSMIALDQVGVLSQNTNTLYVHGDQADGGNGNGQLVGNILQSLSINNGIQVAASSAQEDENGQVPVPPTPLTSLLALSGGNVGGAVLAGYDDAYNEDSNGGGTYRSHRDSIQYVDINDSAIAGAATIAARGAVAMAYYNEDNGGDYENAVEYAVNAIAEISIEDDMFSQLKNCLFVDGTCDLWKQYVNVETTNQVKRTGFSYGVGQSLPLGNPQPNYYVSVYNAQQGQPFVQVGNRLLGAYDGDDYGKAKTDNIFVIPRDLEAGIHGLLNDFLGRGSSSSSNGEEEGELKSCSSTSDCQDVDYCKDGNGNAAKAVCTGGLVCVCSRAHYHVALDEALVAPPNNATGRFVVDKDNDEGISAMYTEPFWSADVGVTVYRQAGVGAGMYATGFGVGVAVLSVVGTWLVRRRLVKEKLY